MKKKIVSAICLVLVLASMLLSAGCSGDGGGSGTDAASISGSGE